MKCKHKSIIYTEILASETTWFFKDGKIDGDPWNETGKAKQLRVQCEDCGLDKTFPFASAPKWVQAYREKVIERFRDYTLSS